VTEKWTTENDLNTTLDVQDKLMPGLKVKILIFFNDLPPPHPKIIIQPYKTFLLESELAQKLSLFNLTHK